MAANNSNPYDAFNFIVEIDGVVAAAFSECVLPSASIEVIEYREGSEAQNNVRKLPGLLKLGDITLKRGLTNSTALWDWFSSIASGTGAPKAMVVTLLDNQRNPAVQWSFSNAWPSKYETPVLNGKANALAIETLVVCVGGMKISAPGK